jgi:hypothetical protein
MEESSLYSNHQQHSNDHDHSSVILGEDHSVLLEGQEIALETFAVVLSLPDESHNRIGMNKLLHVLIQSKATNQNKEARAIVYGGGGAGSPDERLRQTLLYFLCKDYYDDDTHFFRLDRRFKRL